MIISKLLVVSVFFIGGAIGYIIRQLIAQKRIGNVEARAKKIIEEAREEAKKTLLESKEKATKILEEGQKEEKERKNRLLRLEERLIHREENIERKATQLEKKLKEAEKKEKEAEKRKEQIEEVKQSLVKRLEEISQMNRDQAKEELFRLVEKSSKEDLINSIRKLEKERKEELEKRAAQIFAEVIQRYSRSYINEITTTSVPLPNDNLKGKIIGKEGRNIRTFERITGVELIVDETPEVVILSSFDPIRREIAKLALEKLIKDGRIQPAKIEEKVEEARKEISEKIKEAGEEAVYELGIYDFPKEIVFLLGRLAYRTSFGQNVLVHSIEAAYIAKMLAEELNLDVETAKRAALLHDIGKAIDYEVGGNHVDIGRKILEKYGIDKKIIQAMEAHHETYPFSIPEAYIVAAADAASAARPGARRESIENYLKRLESLEKIASSYEGVNKVYAIQAGREIRVFVDTEKIDDYKMENLAKEIAKKIEQELKYPGEIKVNVIREKRAVEYAR